MGVFGTTKIGSALKVIYLSFYTIVGLTTSWPTFQPRLWLSRGKTRPILQPSLDALSVITSFDLITVAGVVLQSQLGQFYSVRVSNAWKLIWYLTAMRVVMCSLKHPSRPQIVRHARNVHKFQYVLRIQWCFLEQLIHKKAISD